MIVSCPVEGNPVNIGTGEKIEYQIDYATADGFLKLERRYVNQNASWKVEEPAQLLEVLPQSRRQMPRYFNNKSLAEYAVVIRGRRMALDPDQPGDPKWRLVRENGDPLYFTSDGLLRRTEAAQGGTITHQYDSGRLLSKTDHLGRSLTYAHDDYDRLVAVTLPDGDVIEYTYGEEEDSVEFYLLKEVRWSNGERISYAYNEPAHVNSSVNASMVLTGKFDADDNRIGTYQYQGDRAVLTEGALGSNRRAFFYASNYTAVTDSLGTRRVVRFTNHGSDGTRLVTRNEQPAGSGCAASVENITYYSNGLKKSQTDFNGHKTQYAYEDERALQIVRVEGIHRTNNQDYLPAGASLPAGVRKISTEWHSQWRQPVREASPHRLITSIYNGDNNPFDGNSIAQCAPADLPLLCHKVEQATTDTNGALGFDTMLDNTQADRHWSYTYNDRGQLLTVTRNLNTTPELTYTYYEQAGSDWRIGDLKSLANAMGQTTDFTAYDVHGRLLRSVDANGVESLFSYDVRGRLVSHTVAGATTTHTYDLNGNRVGTLLPNEVMVVYDYDAARRLVGIHNSDGDAITYDLDTEGNLRFQQITDADGNLRFTRENIYDALSRKQNSMGAEGQLSTFLYDAKGNLRSEVDAKQQSTNHVFDALGQLEKTIDPLNGETRYEYDAQGNLVKVIDPTGLATVYHYNAFGELIEQISPDTGTTTHDYDATGNRIRTTDNRGVITDYEYDALNRLTHIRYPSAPAENVTYTYDDTSNGNYGIGRLTGVQDASGTTLYSYNSLGYITRKTVILAGQTAQIHYEYDAAGQLTGITYPSGRTLSYGRDAQGRISTITTQATGQAPQTLISGAQYLPFGPATHYSYGNGLAHAQTYDLDYRLTGIEITGISPVLERAYSYDPVNNITGIDNTLFPGKSQSFSYDALNRLTSADGPYGFLGYDYDPVGNRLSLLRDNGNQLIAENYTYATDSHRLLSVARELDQQPDSTRSYQYDDAGNRIATESTDGTRQDYAYNAANRMSAVEVNQTPAAEYHYNALGQRVRKVLTSGAQELYYYDDAGQLLAVTDGSGNSLREYVYWDSLKVAVIQSGTVYYLHNDHLGTPQVATNQNQAVVWMADYEPFGAASVDPASTVTVFSRFPGQYQDNETGLYYNYFRDYDPAIGRYVQSDPIGLDGGINTYGYALQNPNTYIDPLGLSSIKVCANPANAAACVAAGVGGRAATRAAAQSAARGAATSGDCECEKLQADIKSKAAEVRRQYYRGLDDPNDLFNRAYSSPNLGKRKGTWMGHHEKFENAKKGLANSINAADAKQCRVDEWDRKLLSLSYPNRPAAR